MLLLKGIKMVLYRKSISAFLIYVAVLINVLGSDYVRADENSPSIKSKYNAAFLRGASEADLEKLLSHNGVSPGTYRVDLYVNNLQISTESVVFFSIDGEVKPCIGPKIMKKIGVRSDADVHYSSQSCADLSDIEYASWSFDRKSQKLFISLPQTFIKPTDNEGFDESLWDSGVTAAFLNYNVQSRFDYNDDFASSSSHYIGLNSGFNIENWRLRNQSTLNHTNGDSNLRSQKIYFERDLTDWRSQLTVGQTYGKSDSFDSPAISGIHVGSDDSMLPNDLRGYSPVVTGIAETNATVEVRQGNNLIYSTTVSPGSFEFRNIPTYGSNGDLEITIIEASGSKKVRTQGFGVLPVMVRENMGRYQFSLGKLDHDSLDSGDRWYFSTDGAYGVLSDLTLYGGAQGMKNYYALNAGFGVGSRYGSFSFDVTHSDSISVWGHNEGQSYRFRFGKVFHDVGTTLALAGYRYATEDYRNLDDHIRDYSNIGDVDRADRIGQVRSNLSVSVTQRLSSDLGGINISASEQDYWSSRPKSRSLAASYGHHLGKLSYQFGVEKTRNDWADNTLFSFSVSHAISWGGGSHNLSAGTVGGYSSDANNNQNIGLSGYKDSYNYSLNASNNASGKKTLSANSSVKSSFGDGGVGYTQGNGYKSYNAHWNGALVAHAGGINVSPAFYDGAILVEVPKQEGVGFDGKKAVTGSNGYAVLESATPYRRNQIMIDTNTLSDGTEIGDNNAQVFPRRGAITYAKIDAKKINRVQFTLISSDGNHYPAGTQLETLDGTLMATADPYGRVLALLEKEEGVMIIRSNDSMCRVNYKLDASNSGYYDVGILKCMH